MKLKYIVTTKYTSGLKEKLKEVKRIIEQSSDIEEITFLIKEDDWGKPDVIFADDHNRIDKEWFEKTISKKYKREGVDGVIFVYSMRDGRRWKVDSGLYGNAIGDNDGFGEMWVKGDKNSVAKFKDKTKQDRITKTVAHELGHDMKHRGFTKVEVHDFDYSDERHDIEGFWKQFRIDKSVESTLLQKLFDLTRMKEFLTYLKGG